MRRFLVFTVMAALGVGGAWALARAPRALARLELFQVRQVRLEGTRFLSREEAVRALALPAEASVWDDVGDWEDRLAAHPLVKEVRIRRRLPSTLVLDVEETEPVALVATPVLEPVDHRGRLLPVDPAVNRLDLPLLTPMSPEREGGLTPLERELLARETALLGRHEPTFLARVSNLSLNHRGDIRAQLWDGDEGPAGGVTFLLRPGLYGPRIQEGMRVLGDARARFRDRRVTGLDLRYDDQVVVRLDPATGG